MINVAWSTPAGIAVKLVVKVNPESAEPLPPPDTGDKEAPLGSHRLTYLLHGGPSSKVLFAVYVRTVSSLFITT